jgi:DnaJ domain
MTQSHEHDDTRCCRRLNHQQQLDVEEEVWLDSGYRQQHCNGRQCRPKHTKASPYLVTTTGRTTWFLLLVLALVALISFESSPIGTFTMMVGAQESSGEESASTTTETEQEGTTTTETGAGQSDSEDPAKTKRKVEKKDTFNAKDHMDWGTYYDPKNIFCGQFDCYKILGFDYENYGKEKPSTKVITKRYRALSREWHPDKSKHKDAKERFTVSIIPVAVCAECVFLCVCFGDETWRKKRFGFSLPIILWILFLLKYPHHFGRKLHVRMRC